MLKQVLSCDEYIETLSLSDIISEQHWSDGVNTSELFKFMQECAKWEHILLSDAEHWDYDTVLYQRYRNEVDEFY